MIGADVSIALFDGEPMLTGILLLLEISKSIKDILSPVAVNSGFLEI